MTRAWRQYTVLAVLFVFATWYEAGNITYVFRTILHPSEVAAAPFSIRNATRIIGSPPLLGDEILSLNGRPFTAKRQFDETVAKAHPGDKLTLVLSEPSGRAIERTLTFGDKEKAYHLPGNVALVVCLSVFIPVVCLTLGFAVAFIRPRDKNAWFLLLLLTGFSGMLGGSDWFSLHPDLQLLWSGMCNSVWSLAMVLFSIYFPGRFALDQKLPWFKYLILVPAAVIQFFLWGVLWIWLRDIATAQSLLGLYTSLAPLNLVVQMVGVSVFFVVLGFKSGSPMAADDLRRLRILRTGGTISLAPMGLVVTWSILRHTGFMAGIPWPVEAAAFFLMALFPLTLAYVIVVERAMDLGFVIRQSAQYAIARGGLWVLRAGTVLFAFHLMSQSTQMASGSTLSAVGIGLLGLVMLRQRNASKASAWLDRKFFREAYDAETVMSDLATEAGRYVEIEPLLNNVAQRIAATLHVPDIVILVRDRGTYRTRYSTRPGQPMDIADNSRIAMALRQSVAPLDVYFDRPQPWIQTLNAEEIQTLDFMRSQLLLALPGRGQGDDRLVGVLSLGAKKSEAPYSTTDIRLLQAVAIQTGMALDNSRLVASLAREAANREVMSRELEIAREVQERLFPQKFPKIEGIDCYGHCRPARGVGGDYYDFVEQPDGKLGIAIGDVSGKGIAAALLMASLQASLRGQAMAGIRDLAELMSNVNKLVYDASQSNRYATFFYGEFDPETRLFVFVNAGHNPPVVLRANEAIRLEASGPVVGLLPGVGYTMDAVQMQPGDIFLSYTDGISEAMNEQDEEWEEDRFVTAARRCSGGPAKEMIDGIFRAADAFTGRAKQYDDMTLLVMKIGV